jgi:ABC-2 type transport system permease protein
MIFLLQVITRLLAFTSKELVEVIRRPGAIVSLVLGPFLIMALFGVGYSGYRAPLKAIVVVPPESGLPTDVDSYQKVSEGLLITSVETDPAPAEEQIRTRQVDVVIEAPANGQQQFESGSQAQIKVVINTADPQDTAYAGVLAARLAQKVNDAVIAQAAGEGNSLAIQHGAGQVIKVPAEVVAEPTRADLVNISASRPSLTAWYGSAVLALILQHMALTLVALSLVRERTSGLMEVFRVSPLSALELVLGKVLGFGLFGIIVTTVTLILLVVGLGVALLGAIWLVAGVLALLLLASLGLGLVVGLISDSERQSVQLSLLLLLASVFFSGFVLPLRDFSEPVRNIAYLLPVTHGIDLVHDVMLQGWIAQPWHVAALGVLSAAFLLIAWIGTRRGMVRI